MLAELALAFAQVRQTFAEASDVLGYDLWDLCQNGPEQRLNATEQTQPAMLTAGVAVWRVWCDNGGPAPAIAAGHSLGEYSALVAAGSLAFADAVRLVRSRGRLMQAAVPEGQGAIAAILGLDDTNTESVCAGIMSDMPDRHVAPVNYNAPGQVVVAGHADAVHAALEAARAAGAVKCVPLPMSVPVHCELMRPAVDGLARELDATRIDAPVFPVVHNADLRTHQDAASIASVLKAQLYTPVRWVDTVRAMRDGEADLLIECGPGRVLSALIKRIDRKLPCLPVFDESTLSKALEATSESLQAVVE